MANGLTIRAPDPTCDAWRWDVYWPDGYLHRYTTTTGTLHLQTDGPITARYSAVCSGEGYYFNPWSSWAVIPLPEPSGLLYAGLVGLAILNKWRRQRA